MITHPPLPGTVGIVPSRPEQSQRLSASRVPMLDGIRGIAILAVMLLHFQQFGAPEPATHWERLYRNLVGFNWAGVNLFFVLSGFLITGILYDSRADSHYFRTFYGRRTVRIFPVYYATLAAYFAAVPLLRHQIHDPVLADTGGAAPLLAWTYMLNWLVGLKGFSVVSPLIQHFWSLSVEEQFYLMWPFVVRALSRRRLMGVCVGLVASAVSLRIALQLFGLPNAAYAWTFSQTDSLAIGAFLALARRDASDWRKLQRYVRPVSLVSGGGLAVLIALLGPWHGGMWMDTAGILLSGLVFGGFLAIAADAPKGSIVRAVTASPLLRFFGKYSYALYVFHQPMAIILRASGMTVDHLTVFLGKRMAAFIAIQALDFALATGLAFASWHLFEKQFLKLKHLPILQYKPAR
jgi:peptidoglycan/LPS O-acetylase OafA/YrhL